MGIGKFRFCRMPAGLVNSAATLSALVDEAFGGDKSLHTYMDDFLCSTRSFKEHIEKLNVMADKLGATGLVCSKEKSVFCQQQLRWLGQLFDAEGVHVDPKKVQAILEAIAPKTVKEIRAFGLSGWYRRYIFDYAGITAALTELLKTKKHEAIVWDAKAQQSFDKLKTALTTVPVLQLPDYRYPFYVEAYCGEAAVGGVLSQRINENVQIIAFMSVMSYQSVEKQALSVIAAIEKLRLYTMDHEIVVVTRNNIVKWLQDVPDEKKKKKPWMKLGN